MKMRYLLNLAILVTATGMSSVGHALEILRWERLPLAVPLLVGQERVVFLDRNVRVGVPAELGDRLRVQSAGGAIYLKANDTIAPTRLQLQDVTSGALILLDIAASPPKDGQGPLEPVRIVEAETQQTPSSADAATASQATEPSRAPSRQTPIPVVLTRYAAQSLYAPLRTVEPVAGIERANVRGSLPLQTLLPTLPVRAKTLGAWRLEDQWVTAVQLTNTASHWLDLDSRALQGDFVAATFQHPTLGPAGDATDTTVVYVVTRGRGLAGALLPAIHAIDPMPPAVAGDRDAK